MGLKATLLKLTWYSSRRSPGLTASGLPTANMATSKTWETTLTPIPSWPRQGRPLKQHTWITNIFLLGDIILSIIPIYFIRKSSCDCLYVTNEARRTSHAPGVLISRKSCTMHELSFKHGAEADRRSTRSRRNHSE